jgi:hypothetical protein
MSDAQEAKDLLSNKPDSDIKWGGSSGYRSVTMVIVKYGPSSTKRDLRKIRRKFKSYAKGQTSITLFKNGKKRVFIFKSHSLEESEASLIQSYYDWVVK